MADYNISANITANTKGYEAGINKVQKTTKTFSASLSKVIQGLGKNGLVGAMGSIGLASAGLSATLGAVVKIAKQVSQAIGECTEAYKQQLIAERQLETAINNNPLVTGSAKKRLTEFASEMQKVSNYGDEQLIPMMANLVSLGRTEEETMKIMAVAMDMSASGSMSLDTAITQLNATLNGNIGRLGQQNAELKGLTDEELKSGKAIDILGEKFKGLSQATLDTSKQLKNIKGDFKEAIGEFTLPSSDMWNKFWMGFYEKGIDIVHKLQASLDSSRGEGIYEKLAGSVKKIKNEEEQRRAISDALSMSTEVELNQLQTYLEGLKKRNALQEKTLEQARATLQYRKDAEEAYQRGLALEEQDEARRQAELDAQKEKEDEIVKLKEEYLKKVAEQEAKWQNIKTITGEEVKAEEKIKFYQDGLVDLMTQAGGQIATNNQLYKDQIAIIQKLQSELTPEEKETSDVWVEKIRQQAIERLKAEKEAYDETVDLEKTTALERYLVRKDLNEKIMALEKEQLIVEMEKALKSVEGAKNEAEEKLRITEYYNKEMEKLANKQVLVMEKEGIKSGYAFAKGFSVVLAGIKEVMSKVIGTIKKVISGAGNIFKKLFDFNPDEALDSLLQVEDKILTFFVETIPKLPAFFESALQSISVLLANIKLNINSKKVKDFVTSLIKTLKKYLPDIIRMSAEIGKEILVGLIQGIGENAGMIASLLTMVASAIIKMLPDVILAIIKAIPNILAGLLASVGNILLEVAKFVVNMIIDGINLLLDGISKVWTWIPGTKGIPHIPHFAKGTENAPTGLAIVGEAGPELVSFRGGEKVYSASKTQRMIQNAGGNTFNVTFNNLQDTSAYAMMSQLRQYNRQMAINSII